MSFLFDLLFFIYMLAYLPILLLRGKGHNGFGERLGSFSPDLCDRLAQQRNIWIHAVSVGEVAAIEAVLRGLKTEYPDTQIVLSVTTKTGHSFALKKYTQDAIVIWSPLDLSFTVRSFVRAIRPVVYIAAETELWPNLFRCLASARVPIVIVNGRISDKAWPRYRFARRILKGTMARVNLWVMQSATDEERVRFLGARPETVHMAGNVKFDNVPDAAQSASLDLVLTPETKLFVAGSTHPGEEEILLNIFRAIRPSYLDLRLVLVPRHPERAASIAELVQKEGFEPLLFSRGVPAINKDHVLIVDTIGQLMKFYAAATVVFVGKSLAARGGHNIIEPALLAKPIIIGPHMQNFRDITQAFLTDKAVIQVDDADELKEAVTGLLTHASDREELGQRARVVVDKNRGASERALDLIKGLGIC